MRKRIKSWWNRFSYEHEDLVSCTKFILAFALASVLTVLFAVALFSAVDAPRCHYMAESFTGNYTYYAFGGCFVEVIPGKYYPINNIQIVPNELEIKVK